LFSTANNKQLLSSLKQEMKRTKRNLKQEMSLDPELRADWMQKERFKQDVIVGNSLRQQYKKKGKPPTVP
jgi:hypothetical protein